MKITKEQLKGYLRCVEIALDKLPDHLMYEVGLEVIPIDTIATQTLRAKASLEAYLCQEQQKIEANKAKETEQQDTTLNA
jgi:hypothetical protein